MKTHLKELLDYTHYHNQKFIQLLLQHPEWFSEKAQKLLQHTLNAQHIWNNRIVNLSPTISSPWHMQEVKELLQTDRQNYEHSLQILESCDLHQSLAYKNLKGESFSNTIQDILVHVVNHGTYHRGQINTELKMMGAEPLVTDYIVYKRTPPVI